MWCCARPGSNAFLGALFAALAACAARAELPAFFDLGGRPEADLLAGGVSYFHAPRYAGAAQSRTILVPSATAYRTDGLFADVVNGVGWNASADKRFEYGPRVTLGAGREASGALHDMGRIPRRPVLGGFANWVPAERIEVQSSLRYGSGYGRDGALLDLGASWDFLRYGYASMALDASASWANRAYMRSFYGVSAAQSAASGYPRHDPPAGLQWTTLALSLSTPLHPRVFASISVERTRLGARAAASPYAERRHATAIQANISYAFMR